MSMCQTSKTYPILFYNDDESGYKLLFHTFLWHGVILILYQMLDVAKEFSKISVILLFR